eukprot:4463247-Pleurochrysis_carterae.AAC.2
MHARGAVVDGISRRSRQHSVVTRQTLTAPRAAPHALPPSLSTAATTPVCTRVGGNAQNQWLRLAVPAAACRPVGFACPARESAPRSPAHGSDSCRGG